jgi:hypothetical protein
MKIKLLFLLLLIGSGLTAQNVPSYVPTNGLVGWWPFNSNANDESGNGNNGSVNGATLTSDRFGNLNSAYHFSVTNQITTTYTGVSGNGARTISLWFKPDYLNNTNDTWVMAGYGGGTPGSSYGPTYINNNPGLDINYSYVYYNYAVPLTSWTHYCAVYDPSYGNDVMSIKIYINGVFQANSSYTYNLNQVINTGVGATLFFGKSLATQSFIGNLDDFGFWDRALTQQEVVNLYNASNPAPILSCTGAFLPQNLFNGLVGWYPFCGDAEDESQNGNNGTVNGATLTSDRFGNANSAYSFDGVDDYIEVADTNILDLYNHYTLSGWYLTSSTTQFDQAILGKGSGITQTGCQLLVNTNTAPTPRLQFGFNNNAGINGGATTPVTTANLSGWHLLTGTYDGSSAKLYLDGFLMSTVQISYSLINSTQPFLIGNEAKGLIRYFNGKLDDIGIWNRALDSSEVAQLYSTGLCQQTITGSCDTLIFNANLTGFNPITYGNQVKVYPNPASDNLVIDCGSNFTGLNGYSIQITNVLGQTVYNSPITAQVTNIQLNPPTWVNGTYVVQFINPQGTVLDTKRIIIQ